MPKLRSYSRRSIILCMVLLIGLGVLLGGIALLNTPSNEGEFTDWEDDGGGGAVRAAETVLFTDVYVGYTAIPKTTITHIHHAGVKVYITPTSSNSNFSVSPNYRIDLPSAKPDSYTTITVSAKTGLGVGTHETIVSFKPGSCGCTSPITVKLTVKAQPAAMISVTPTTINFGTMSQGATPPAQQSVTVKNISAYGSSATGAMTVTREGVNPNNFTVSVSSLSSLNPQAYTSFTIRPISGLNPGTYSATIKVGNDTVGYHFVYVNVAVKQLGISLTGDHTFSPASFGYGTRPPPHTAVITNTGTEPTGALSIEVTGANSSSFQLDKFSVANISPGATSNFTVQPHFGLAIGNHSAVITVKSAAGNSNVIAQKSFSVFFSVQSYGITLSPTDYNFGEKAAGYSALTAQTVTVTNIGNQPTGALSIGLSGANPEDFELSKTSLPSITSINSTASFTVRPKTQLASGLHSAIVTVSSSDPNVTSKTMTVRFYVTAPTIKYTIVGVDVDSSGSYLFPAMDVGYPNPPEPYYVNLTNTGNQASGQISVALSGAGGSSFLLANTPVQSIGVNGNATFSIQPKPNLPAGTYIATVTLSGTGLLIQFNVRFDVRSYGISLSTSQLTFSNADSGYGVPPAAQTITITSTGNQSTGTLTATAEPCAVCKSTPNACFAISAISPQVISNQNGQATFTIRPNTRLEGGEHTAIITVKGSEAKVQSQSVNVKFFVRELAISLTPAEHDFGVINQRYTAEDLQGYIVTARITNVGNTETEDLDIWIMDVSNNFEVSRTSVPSIKNPGSWVEFTVKPKLNLPGGKHSALIVVGGENIPDQAFEVKLHVKSQGIELSDDFPFGAVRVNYTAPPDARYVTIYNIGNDPTGDLTVSFVSEAFGTFSLSDYPNVTEDSIVVSSLIVPSIPRGESRSFPIQPMLGLVQGVHSATVRVRNGEGNLDAQFYTKIEVQSSSIELSDSELILLPAAEGYSPANLSRIVTIYSTGNAATGLLNITFEYGDIEAFTLPRTSVSSILPKGRTTFTIQPAPGLERGSYSVIVKVSGEFVEPRYVEVTFFVGGFGILLSQAGLYSFADGRRDYYTPAELEVTVTNIGDMATGPMTVSLEGNHHTKFTLNIGNTFGTSLSLESIGYKNGTTKFNVMPVAGLTQGRYTVTVIVKGNNIASQSFDITFKVFRYGCPCEDQTPRGDYTLLYIIPSLLGIALLLWLGLRPLPQTEEQREEAAQGKAEDDLSNLLTLANSAPPQQAYVPPPPQQISVSQPQAKQPVHKPAPAAPRESLTDQILSAAKAKVADSAAQRSAGTAAAPSAKQVSGKDSAAPSAQGQHPQSSPSIQTSPNKGSSDPIRPSKQ